MLSKFKGWRTLAINAISLLVLLLGALTGTVTDETTLQVIAIALAAGNLILRLLTTTPAGQSGSGV